MRRWRSNEEFERRTLNVQLRTSNLHDDYSWQLFVVVRSIVGSSMFKRACSRLQIFISDGAFGGGRNGGCVFTEHAAF